MTCRIPHQRLTYEKVEPTLGIPRIPGAPWSYEYRWKAVKKGSNHSKWNYQPELAKRGGALEVPRGKAYSKRKVKYSFFHLQEEI